MAQRHFLGRVVQLVVGDTGRVVRVGLRDPVAKDAFGNKLPLDLSDAGTTVVMRMHEVGGGATLKATVTCSKLAGIVRNGVIDTAVPYNVPGSGGLVSVDFVSGDVDTAGEYEGEFYITFGNGKAVTIDNLLRVSIRKRIGT